VPLRWIAIAMLAALSACASGQPKSTKARMTVIAQSDVNPDATGRPSPVVVRVYQLQQDAKFANADFFALFDDEQQALGGDLLARDEITLAPGERKEVQVEVKGEAKFLGAVAAFRDIRNSPWRVVQPEKRPARRVQEGRRTGECGARQSHRDYFRLNLWPTEPNT
jgi:type VI secretion system protein VasD